MKQILAITFTILMFIGYNGFSQTTKSCKPTSCGPENTKKQEAAVITNLRSDLIALQTELTNKNILTSKKDILKDKELTRSTDAESLLVIATQLWKIHIVMTTSIPTSKVEPNFAKLEFDFQLEGARLVTSLSSNLKVMRKQVRKLQSI